MRKPIVLLLFRREVTGEQLRVYANNSPIVAVDAPVVRAVQRSIALQALLRNGLIVIGERQAVTDVVVPGQSLPWDGYSIELASGEELIGFHIRIVERHIATDHNKIRSPCGNLLKADFPVSNVVGPNLAQVEVRYMKQGEASHR